MYKEVAWGSSFVLGGFLIVIMSFLFINGNGLAGKVISEEVEIAEAERNVGEGSDFVCNSGTCNQDNSLEVCANGKWVKCQNGEVCTLGKCVRPAEGLGKTRLVVGGTGESSGGGELSQASSQIQTSETSREVGNVGGSKIEEITIDEKLIFITNREEHFLIMRNMEITNADFTVDDGSLFNLLVGEEKRIDYNNDGVDDFTIILKSIGLATKKAKILLNEL